MTLDQLRIFVAVAERQHLTQAADVLALTPSAVSASLRALEERYGTQLFDRVGRRIEVNAAARIFLDEARATLARAAGAERVLVELAGLARGALALQASQTIASYWLPPLLVRFRETHPQIDVRLDVGNTQSVAKDSKGESTSSGFAINTQHVKTKVMVENGGTVVLGGIYQMSETRSDNKVPLIGDIPVVGNLFKSTSRQNSKTELLVFITPRIVAERLQNGH
ncbi:hypothetical protein GCM10025794_25990 [Massilia kyonggiensis]